MSRSARHILETLIPGIGEKLQVVTDEKVELEFRAIDAANRVLYFAYKAGMTLVRGKEGSVYRFAGIISMTHAGLSSVNPKADALVHEFATGG